MAEQNQMSGLILHIKNCAATGKQCWLPGQTISGYVKYTTRKDQEEIKDAFIEFSGKTQTDMAGKAKEEAGTERETVHLFSHKQQLFRGPFTVVAQTLIWPFEFRFPETAGYDCNNQGGLQSGRRGAGPIGLPPSFAHSTGSLYRAGKGYVRYRLKVVVNNSRIVGGKKLERDVVLIGASNAPLPDPVLQLTKFPAAWWHSQKLRREKHSFSQKLAHVFTNRPELQSPNISFSATLQVPLAISTSQPSDMVLFVKQIRRGPTDPENPELVLGDVILRLQGCTEVEVRGSKPTKAYSYVDNGEDEVGTALFKASTTSKEQHPDVLPLDGSAYTVARGWRFADFERTISPLVADFSTWMIRHTHKLKIEMEVVHPESGHVFKLKSEVGCQLLSDSFSILPTDQASPPLPATVGGLQGLRSSEEEQLPAYTSRETGVPDTDHK